MAAIERAERRNSGRGVVQAATERSVLAVLIFIVWLVATNAGLVNKLTLPSPQNVLPALGDILTSAADWAALGETMIQIVISLVIALLLGSSLSLLAWRYPLFRSAVFPWITIANAVPNILFYPVAIVLVGLGTPSIVVLASMLGTFAVSELTYSGLRAVRPVYLDVARVLEASRNVIMRKVVLSASFTILVSALRVSFTTVFVAVVAAEYILSADGIGYELHQAYENFQTGQVYGFVLLIGIVAVASQLLLTAAMRRLRGQARGLSKETSVVRL